MDHTPKPWKVEEDESGDNVIRCGEHNSFIVGNIEGLCGTCLKNARLAALAPDMYDAIKEFLEWGAMTSSDREYFERMFREIIAKADGPGG